MRGSRNAIRRGSLGAVVVLVTMFLLAPTASAQVGDVEDVVDETRDKVNGTADDTTDAVDEATGGASEPATDLIDETVGQANDTVDEASDEVRDTTKPIVDTVRDTIREQLVANDPASDSNAGSARDTDPSTGFGSHSGIGTRPGEQVLSDSLSRTRARTGDSEPIGATISEEPSLFERFLERSGEVLKAVAFPVALLLLVAAFLAIQSRMDRRDPKLALAALDQDQEFLSFN